VSTDAGRGIIVSKATTILRSAVTERQQRLVDIDVVIYRLIDEQIELEKQVEHLTSAINILAKPQGCPRGMYQNGGRLERARAMLLTGYSMRQIRSQTGMASATITKLRHVLKDEGIEPVCGCGQPTTHRGWCSVRFARSPARQSFMRRWHQTKEPG